MVSRWNTSDSLVHYEAAKPFVSYLTDLLSFSRIKTKRGEAASAYFIYFFSFQ